MFLARQYQPMATIVTILRSGEAASFDSDLPVCYVQAVV